MAETGGGGETSNSQLIIAALVVAAILGYYYYQNYKQTGGLNPTNTPQFTVTPDYSNSAPLLP